MTAGGNITNITTGGGGNMTAGENRQMPRRVAEIRSVAEIRLVRVLLSSAKGKLTSQIFLIDISFPSRHARGVTVRVKMAIWG